MMPASSRSNMCCTSGAVAMFGACSPPRPSAPWQPAQLAANIAAPGCCACSAAVDSSARIAAGTKTPRPQTIFANDPLLTLEQELQCYLHDARIVATGTSYITETTLPSVVDEPIRIRKLRMVEDIECFCPKLQLSGLGDGGALQQGHIVIVDARTGEGSPHGVAYLPDWFRDEIVGVEIGQALSRVLISIKRAAVVGVAWHIYVCIKGAKQRIIVILIESDRFSLGKGRYPGKLPARREPLRKIPSADEVIEGQLHGVAGDQVMRDVKAGQCAGLGRIDRVGCVKGIRSIIQRFLKGIANQEVEVFFGVLQGDLQGVEAGAYRGLHVRVAVEVNPEGPGSVHCGAARGGVNRVFAVGAASG